MNEIAPIIRIALINVISPLVVEGVTIPIFDKRVNPNVPIPTLLGAKCYVIIKNQQEVETIGCKVGYRQNALISVDINVKYPANVGSSVTTELISGTIQPMMHDANFAPLLAEFGWNLMKLTRPSAIELDENGNTQTNYRKLITYQFDVFQETISDVVGLQSLLEFGLG
jgi:hypothetical protein